MKFAYCCFFAVFWTTAFGGGGIDFMLIAAETFGVITAGDCLARYLRPLA